jgi:hypothetical protein
VAAARATAAAAAAATYTVSPELIWVDATNPGRPRFQVRCDRPAAQCERYSVRSNVSWATTGSTNTYQGDRDFIFAVEDNPSTTSNREAVIGVFVTRSGAEVRVARMLIRQRAAPAGPVEPDTSTVRVAQTGPLAPWMVGELTVSVALRDSAVTLEIDAARTPAVVMAGGRSATFVVPELPEGVKRVRVLAGTRELARGTLTLSGAVPEVDRRGAARLAAVQALADTTVAITRTLNLRVAPRRGDTLTLSRALLGMRDEAQVAAELLRAAGASNGLQLVRALGSLPASVDAALLAAATQLGALAREVRDVSQAASVAAGIVAADPLDGAHTQARVALAGSSMRACEEVARRVAGEWERFNAQIADVAATLRVWAVRLTAVALAAAAIPGIGTALAVVAAVTGAFAVVTQIAWSIFAITKALVDLAPSRFVPAPVPNAYVQFRPPAVRAGGSASFDAFGVYMPYGARADRVLALVRQLIVGLRDIRAGINDLADLTKVLTRSEIGRYFTDGWIERVASAFDAVEKDARAVEDYVERVLRERAVFTVERPLTLGDGIDLSPLAAPDGTWRLLPQGAGGTFTTTAAAKPQVIDVRLSGASTDPVAAAVCRFASNRTDDAGRNRVRILPPPPRAVLQVGDTAQWYLGSVNGPQVRDRKTSTGISFNAVPWSLSIETNAGPTQKISVRNSGRADEGTLDVDLRAAQTWTKTDPQDSWAWLGTTTWTVAAIYVTSLAPGETAWLVVTGTPRVAPAGPGGASIVVRLPGKQFSPTNARFSESVQLSRIPGPTRVIEGVTYEPYGVLSATASTGFGQTCIMVACTGPLGVFSPTATLTLSAKVQIRK